MPSTTNRDRFISPLHFCINIDHLAVIEWTPFWYQTIRRWESEGLDRGMPDENIKSYFGLDYAFKSIAMFPKGENYPALTYGRGCVNSMEDYEDIKQNQWVYPERIIENAGQIYEEAGSAQSLGKYSVGIGLFGFFWWPRELLGMENFLYTLYDCPELIHAINSDLLKFSIARVEEIYRYLKPDFFVISEDMCYKHGPLISYELFKKFMLPYYLEFVPVLKKYNAIVLMDTDGQCEPMIPWIIEAGLDGCAPCERNAGVDPVRIREEYPRFIMIGGFNKMVMHKGEAAIRKEFEYLLPLMSSGGFLPSCDHQVPPGVSLSDYKLYVKLLKEYCKKAVKQ